MDRGSAIAGLFYGMGGMRVGGMRRLEILPHSGHRAQDGSGLIPGNAVLVADGTVAGEK
jgi:FKBP-type peptidyl-prolyl cis-trans isomerase